MTIRRQADDAVSRREFVKWSALGGTALLLGITPGGDLVSASGASIDPARLAPNQWLEIDDTGRVTIVAARSEMGQGVRTALPMIVAEELGADWSRVSVVHARPSAAFREMRTSGSGSVSGSWDDLRRAAAAAREMLIAAAMTAWSAERSDCVAEGHAVSHTKTGARLGFESLVATAARLPVPTSAPLKPASEYRLLGSRVARVDGPQLVSGRAMFGLDARPPGVAVAVIARPPQHGASVRDWSDSRARAVPGVMHAVRISSGIAVIARSTWAAMKGRDALTVRWTQPPSDRSSSAAYQRALEGAIDGGKKARREGRDVDASLAAASRRMEATYRTPFQAHAAMEPLNCVADVRGDGCEIWVGTQAPNQAQERVAMLLGVPLDRVTINVTLLGGGFGRRLDVDYVLEAVEVSRATKMPVQVVWTREDDIRHDRYQPGQLHRIAAGIDASGSVIAWRHRVADYHLSMFGPYDAGYDPAADQDPWGAYDTPYAFPALDVTLALLESPVPSGAWRSVTYPASVFARECFLDEVAQALGRDPVALRLALVPSPGNVTRASGTRPNGDRLRRVIALAAEKAEWGAPLRPSADGRRWGRGIACNAFHGQTMVAQVAEVSVGATGDVRVHRVVCAVDCGQIINLSGLEAQFESGVAWALSAALKGEATFLEGRTQQSNFHDFPVMRMNEMPVVEVHAVPSTLPPFGVGEPPVPAMAPAVLNAVFAATGIRVRHLPVRASDLRS